MRRVALLLLPAALAVAAPAAASAAPATVKVVECTPALLPEGRSATFEARVRAVPGTDRLGVRFTLQTRGQGELEWRRVVAPGLDTWLSSHPGVGRYGYAKTVRGLAAPASYRVVVRFRWLDAEGAVLRTARRVSKACRQADLRPDLVPVALEVLDAADPAERRYVATVRNAGRTAAQESTVTLRAGEALPAPGSLPALLPGEQRSVAFVAPLCAPGDELELTADAGSVVDEADEARNALVVPCPVAE